MAEKEVKKVAKKEAAKDEAPKLPQVKFTAEEVRLLALRRRIKSDRPKFVRTASHRYWRIGRRDSWRRPRGMQSKQRRHYGYRPTVVSIGFGSPAKVSGTTALGFRPIVIHSIREVEELEPERHIIIIGRTVGTKRRLVLEEAVLKKGFRITNPLNRGGGDEE